MFGQKYWTDGTPTIFEYTCGTRIMLQVENPSYVNLAAGGASAILTTVIIKNTSLTSKHTVVDFADVTSRWPRVD